MKKLKKDFVKTNLSFEGKEKYNPLAIITSYYNWIKNIPLTLVCPTKCSSIKEKRTFKKNHFMHCQNVYLLDFK